jgi:hypothetical protein
MVMYLFPRVHGLLQHFASNNILPSYLVYDVTLLDEVTKHHRRSLIQFLPSFSWPHTVETFIPVDKPPVNTYRKKLHKTLVPYGKLRRVLAEVATWANAKESQKG